MKITVNGQPIDEQVDDKHTLANALQTVEENHVDDNQVITSIQIDGEPLTAERLSIWKDRPVTDFDEANVDIQSRNSFAASALRQIADHLQNSSERRDEIVDLLGQGHSKEAFDLLPGYLQVWNAVQQNLASAARLLNTSMEELVVYNQEDPSNPKEEKVDDRINNLAEQLDQIKSALEAGDMVLLGDILDYEFSEQTDIWYDMLNQIANQFEPNNMSN